MPAPAAARGADLLALSLATAGVRRIFTLSGNQIMPVFDACIDAGIELVHVRHEGAAVYMAEAHAQLTGTPGVALLTAGPGFANGLSALFSARASETPLLLLSGDAAAAETGTGAFQEMAQAAIAGPLAKAAWTATGAFGLELARAWRTALAGRPGPVHLALPFDVLNAPAAGDPPTEEAFVPEETLLPEATARSIAAALATAARPLVLVGPSLTRTRTGDQLDRLEAATGAPVLAMESPRGLRDPGLGALAALLPEIDTLVLLAKPVDFMLGFGRPLSASCRVLAVDPDPRALERAAKALGDRLALASVADPRPSLRALLAAGRAPATPSSWASRIHAAAAARPDAWATHAASAGRIHPIDLCRAVQTVLDGLDDPVLVVDGGEFGQWSQACLRARRRIVNGPSGAIGGALPYAAAARSATGAPVVALLGDGTAGFYAAELDTALRHALPYVAVVGNDARWNAEHVIQVRDFGADRLIGCGLERTRYDLVATGFGCHGEHVTEVADLEPALRRALAAGRPALVNVEIAGEAAPPRPSLPA